MRSHDGTGSSATTSSSSPAPTSTASRSSRRPRTPASPRRSSPTASRPKFVDAWKRLNIANDDFIRTTEPRHKAAVAELLQRCYDAGDIELDVFKGLYCVACELYYSDEDLVTIDGVENLCPIHQRPVEYFEEENYFFRLSRFEDRLLDWYAKHPTAMTPEHRGNEALGLIRGGLRDFSISRTSLEWGIPLPWDPEHVTYVWFDALTNYLAAVGFGDRQRDGYEDWWPVDYHLIGKDIVRQHCVYWPAMLMSAGIEPPQGWAIGGWLLVGGEKMSKTAGNAVNPLDMIDDVGLDGFRYYVLAETPYGNDGDFTFEGLVARYNSDLANNLGNLLARVATVVGKKCDGIGPACDPASPLAAAATTAYADAAAAWDVVQPARALDATWQLIRATNGYLETNEPWKAEPGPDVDRVMGDALEALRIVAVLVAAAIPDTAQTVWERIGLPGNVADQRLPAAAAWGQYAGGTTVTKGESLFPRLTATDGLVRLALPRPRRADARRCERGRWRRRTRPGSRRWSPSDATGRRRSPPSTWPPPTTACYATVGLHPHDASNGVDTILDLLDTPGDRRRGRSGARLLLRALAARRPEGRLRRPDPTRPRTTAAARDPQPRRLGDTFDILRAEGTPAGTIFHCFTGGPDEAQACLDLGAMLSFSGIVTFKGAPEVQAAARLCPLDRMLVETDSPYLAPLPHRGKPNRPAWVAHVGQFIADLRDVPASDDRRRHHRQRPPDLRRLTPAVRRCRVR